MDEIDERVIEAEAFTDDQLAVLHKDGPRTEIEYRLAWARTYLKGIGALDNPERGTWVATEKGKALQEHEIEPLRKEYLAQLAEVGKKTAKAAKEAGAELDLAVEEGADETDK